MLLGLGFVVVVVVVVAVSRGAGGVLGDEFVGPLVGVVDGLGRVFAGVALFLVRGGRGGGVIPLVHALADDLTGGREGRVHGEIRLGLVLAVTLAFLDLVLDGVGVVLVARAFVLAVAVAVASPAAAALVAAPLVALVAASAALL